MYRRPPVPPLPAPVFPYPTLVRPSGSRFGFATGLTSQIAHAGGPPFQMWVTPRRLPHLVFIGTSSVLFALINWMKVPAYLALGAFQIGRASCRGRVCQYVYISVVAVTLKKNTHQ